MQENGLGLNDSVVGYFDGLFDGILHGWVRRVGTDLPFTVKILVDDQMQGMALANGERQDLKDAGVGNCYFTFAVGDAFMDGEFHSIIFLDAATDTQLLDSPYSVLFPRKPGMASPPRFRYDMDDAVSAVASPAPETTLSVVIPTYNRAGTLESTLDVILAQAAMRKDIEVIVIDDGSTDDTPNILERKRRQWPMLRTQSIPNGGAGPARNIGASMAEGDLLLFLGDDTVPCSRDFFAAHIDAHRAYPGLDKAVLGKITWPADKNFQTNFVMHLIQGDGQQQFGYKFMKPWSWYSWQFFYTSNISMKRALVSDWAVDGFSSDFYLYGYEDGEFAYRLLKKNSDFKIFYVPSATVEHQHPYSLRGVLNRQLACGMMLDVFAKRHPEILDVLLDAPFKAALQTPNTGHDVSLEYYVSVAEGLKSWALILESSSNLGSMNWHGDFLNALFKFYHYHGYLLARPGIAENHAAAYRCLLDDFMQSLNRTIRTEALGDLVNINFLE